MDPPFLPPVAFTRSLTFLSIFPYFNHTNNSAFKMTLRILSKNNDAKKAIVSTADQSTDEQVKQEVKVGSSCRVPSVKNKDYHSLIPTMNTSLARLIMTLIP